MALLGWCFGAFGAAIGAGGAFGAAAGVLGQRSAAVYLAAVDLAAVLIMFLLFLIYCP